MKNLLVVLSILFLSATAGRAQGRIDEFRFLLGTYDVQVYLPDGNNGWKEGGRGKAHFYPILDSTFIREDLNLNFGEGTLTMSNSIGRDSRQNQLRMIAMDKEYASIDIYIGHIEKGNIIFNNLTSDRAAPTDSGAGVHFRITYFQVSQKINQSLVEMTSDEGKTWKIYSKQLFNRVGK